MINLLPPDRQEMYRYACRNSRMRRWIAACSLAFIGLIGISAYGVWHINQTARAYDGQIAAAEQNLSVQKQADTERQARDISGSIRLAVQVLSKEILFSDLLRQLAAVTPNDVALANLNISQIEGALDITANTATYEAATQLQVNLADPGNKIFSKADIVSISCSAKANPGSPAVRYPCTVTIRALFAADNPYLFTNNRKAGTP